jgi:hypothetical protein
MVLLNNANNAKTTNSTNSENRGYRSSHGNDDRQGQQGQGGPGQRRKRSKPPFQGYGKTFIEQNSEHHRKYNELLKEERTWLGQGQYWLSKEAGRRAKCLLDGDVEGSKMVTVTCAPCRQLGREYAKEWAKHQGDESWVPPMCGVPDGCSCMEEYQNLFVKTKKF